MFGTCLRIKQVKHFAELERFFRYFNINLGSGVEGRSHTH